MGYMQGASQKGLELVAKVTKLLNSLTDEDYENTHAYVKVELIEEDYGSSNERVLGYWLDEHGPGCWSYFDGEPPQRRKPETVEGTSLVVHLSEITLAIDSERPNNRTADRDDSERQARAVVRLLEARGLM